MTLIGANDLRTGQTLNGTDRLVVPLPLVLVSHVDVGGDDSALFVRPFLASSRRSARTDCADLPAARPDGQDRLRPEGVLQLGSLDVFVAGPFPRSSLEKTQYYYFRLWCPERPKEGGER